MVNMNPGTHTVLIAEDDPMIRQSLAVRLRQAGFGVLATGNGIDAEQFIDQRHVDAAILDVKMPGADGFQVCQHIRESGKSFPVFMLTGAEDGLIRNHLELLTNTAGGTLFFTKPFDAKMMALMLHDALQSRSVSTDDITSKEARSSAGAG